MTNTGNVPPHQGWFDESEPADPGLKVELLLIERCIQASYGPWRIAGALVRDPGGQARWVPDWVDDTYQATPDDLWAYLVDKQGGNGITWEVGFLRISASDDAPKIAAYYDGLYRKENPFGFTAPELVGPTVHDPNVVDDAPRDADGASDPCAAHIHVEMPFAAADPLSWRLAVELVRRHPEELWILRTFPMDGMYDCLSIRRLPDVLYSPSIAVNRNGTHVKVDWLGRSDGAQHEGVLLSWGNGYAAEDPREWIVELEEGAGLDPPGAGLPPSTRSSLALRWIAAFLAMQTGSRPRWSAWNDWAELDLGQPPASFDAIPAAGEWLRARTPEAAALVWFVGTMEGDQRRPELALSVDGDLWRQDREAIDLPEAYRSAGSSLASLVLTTAGDLLP
jgi:hypothetical protein